MVEGENKNWDRNEKNKHVKDILKTENMAKQSAYKERKQREEFWQKRERRNQKLLF